MVSFGIIVKLISLALQNFLLFFLVLCSVIAPHNPTIRNNEHFWINLDSIYFQLRSIFKKNFFNASVEYWEQTEILEMVKLFI